MTEIIEKMIEVNKNRYTSSKDIVYKLIIKIIKKKQLNKRNIISFIFSSFIALLIICNSVNSTSFIKRMSLFIDNSNNFAGFIIAGIISGYMLFNGLLRGSTVKRLISSDGEEDILRGKKISLFESINNYFVEILVLITMFFGFNFLLIILINLLDKFSLTIYHKVFFGLVYNVYIFISINLLIEFICFIYNIYNLILFDSITKVNENK